jgi:hypothetical protein
MMKQEYEKELVDGTQKILHGDNMLSVYAVSLQSSKNVHWFFSTFV